jgi:Tfp pilus assembly protein PilF
MRNTIKKWFQFPLIILSEDIKENSEKLSSGDSFSVEIEMDKSTMMVENIELSYQMKDADLEYLFHQLLEGVVNGWQGNRVAQFLRRLESKIPGEVWLAWLERYRVSLLESSAPQSKLAERMLLLGQLSVSEPFVKSIMNKASHIGGELLNLQRNQFVKESLSSSKGWIPDYPPSPEYQIVPSELSSAYDDENLIIEDETINPAEIMAEIEKKTNSHSKPTLISKLSSHLHKSVETVDDQEKLEDNISGDTVYQLSAEDLFTIGLENAQKGDVEKALSLWQEAVTIDPNFAPAWHNLGSAFAYLNCLEKAIDSFDKALGININDYLSWNDRGNALFRLKRWQEALVSWDRVIGIKPDFEEAWYHRGLVLEKLEHFSGALNSYQRCLMINPDFSPAQKRREKLMND